MTDPAAAPPPEEPPEEPPCSGATTHEGSRSHRKNREACEASLGSGAACRFAARHVYEGRLLCGVHARQRAAEASCPECPVCLDPVSKRAQARMECGHLFHGKCLRAWFRGRPLRCPMCRAVCLSGLALLGPRMAPRLLGLTRTLPPPPRAFFPAYIISHLESAKVAEALGADQDLVSLLVDLACECFTRDNFFAKVRALGL